MNITQQDNLTRTSDKLSQHSYSVFVSKTGTGIDCREASSVSGFTLSYSQPQGTDIRFAFHDGTSWFTLNTSGGAVNLPGGQPDYPALSAYGNTPAQLSALKSAAPFVGKLIRCACALTSDDVKNIKPWVKLGVKASALKTQTELVELSPIYDLGTTSSVSQIDITQACSSGATVSVAGKLFREDGSESEWMSPQDIKGAAGTALQLMCSYKVTAAGSGSAELLRAEAVCVSGGAGGVTGTGEIYFVTEDWKDPVRACRATVRHSPLEYSSMEVFAAFRPAPKYSVRENLGISSGKRDTFTLANKKGIKADTFRLFADEQELYSGFEMNGAAGRVSFTAPEGSIMTCTYQWGWENEQWQEMTLASRKTYPDYVESEYVIENSSEASACSLMIKTSVQSGHIGEDRLGYATGHAQTVRLKRRCVGKLYLESGGDKTTASGYEKAYQVPQSSYTLLDGSRLVRFACPAGELVRAAYDWEAEPVRIFQTAAVFS